MKWTKTPPKHTDGYFWAIPRNRDSWLFSEPEIVWVDSIERIALRPGYSGGSRFSEFKAFFGPLHLPCNSVDGYECIRTKQHLSKDFNRPDYDKLIQRGF